MSETYSFNSRYLLKDGKPWFPVMGEIHFSRYHSDLWEEELRKMKAGGVSIASVYVIWLHHEEEEGVFDFTGDRCLRGFLEVAKEVGISVFLRLGPWVHGEARNGGFPDWLMKKGLDLRSDDPGYLAFVRRYWEKVYEQAEGFLLKDGGPIIGMQIENEYGHVGGYRGEKGEQHMRTLTALARELGFDVPLNTATGWGGAVTGGLLPVMGGYCEAPWDQRITEIEPNSNYVFSHIRNDSLIASDHHVDDTVTFNQDDFPFLTAELGGGVQVTTHRRPIATGSDIGAMSLTKLGSGVALLGYYMYHGGSNPNGKLSTLQESRETGYTNDLPEINYDFNAPIRQFGTISDNYREIRLLAYFLQDFGEDLATLPAEIDPEFVKPQDQHTLRLSYRHDDTHGYIFVNNYQRRQKMDEHRDVVLEGRLASGSVVFPKTDIAPGEYEFYPYNMQLDDAILVSALATPLCRLATADGNVYVFYGDKEPQFNFKDEKKARILKLNRELALQATRVHLDQDYLVLSDDFVWEENGSLKVVGDEETVMRTYPALTRLPEGFEELGCEDGFHVYRRERPVADARAVLTLSQRTAAELSGELKNSCGQPENISDDCIAYEIDMEYSAGKPDANIADYVLYFDYACDTMAVYADGRKINDYIYTGQKAVLSLGYFGFPEKLTAVLHPLYKDAHVYLQEWPKLEDGKACRIDAVTVKLSQI